MTDAAITCCITNISTATVVQVSVPVTRRSGRRESLPLPRELYIESTTRCNEFCDQCPRTHLGREADRDISLAEIRGVYTLFNSNALLLNELRVSLDGATPTTYARVRGVNQKAPPLIVHKLFDTPFEHIWNGERYQAFRAAFESDTLWPQCADCGTKWSL